MIFAAIQSNAIAFGYYLIGLYICHPSIACDQATKSGSVYTVRRISRLSKQIILSRINGMRKCFTTAGLDTN